MIALVKMICGIQANRYLFNEKSVLSEILEQKLSVDVSSREISSEISSILAAPRTFQSVAFDALQIENDSVEMTSYISLERDEASKDEECVVSKSFF